MPKFRTVNPSLWQHPFFRRQPWYVMHVFLFLFSSHADDEGRFVADPFAILEGAFSRNHPVTEQDIETALSALVEADLLLLYEGHGFLTGWYEHQYILPLLREPSSLPPPPIELNSWEVVDAVRADYAKAKGLDLKRTQFRPALHWWMQNQYRNNIDEYRINRLKGKERKGKEVLPSVPSGTESDATPTQNRKNETRKQREQRLLAEEAALREQFSEDELQLVDAYISLADAELKTGTTVGGRVTRIQQLVDVLNEVGDDGAFLYGLEQACNSGAPNKNYVKKAALSQLRKRL